ncbi:hypothetical protein PG996_015046 [Apiospora saccharicola]|uniref:Uncharacterized protein n=1 Tax=Apiospora saccharicola TaxID=335842 RepID=A0ABR1TK62_9PEZI
MLDSLSLSIQLVENWFTLVDDDAQKAGSFWDVGWGRRLRKRARDAQVGDSAKYAHLGSGYIPALSYPETPGTSFYRADPKLRANRPPNQVALISTPL